MEAAFGGLDSQPVVLRNIRLFSYGETMHDWHVIGRAEVEKLILVECQLTGKLGSVKHFTPAQWERAASGSYNAWRWSEKWGEVLELTASVA